MLGISFTAFSEEVSLPLAMQRISQCLPPKMKMALTSRLCKIDTIDLNHLTIFAREYTSPAVAALTITCDY